MIRLAQDTIDDTDIKELARWLLQTPTPQLTKGKLTFEYEQEYAKLIDRKYCIFVNSGSSANLLMVYSLIVSKRLKNNKIVIPSLGWITTTSPAIMFGLDPILCDINLDNLSADLIELEKIFIKDEPSAFILVTVLGIVPDITAIEELCKKYGVILMIDNCESQCSKYQDKSIESFGLISTCSSYYGHFSGTIEGGIIATDDKELYNIFQMLRSHGWLRDAEKDVSDSLREKWGIDEFNHLYTFYYPAFNVRATDLQAFLGLRQLKKQVANSTKRHNNFLLYESLLNNSYWRLKIEENSFISNLGYPVIHPLRDKIVSKLKENRIEVRPLISGSMGTQPFWIERYGKQVLTNASICTKFGFYVPNHPSLSESEIVSICAIINSF